MLFLDNAGLILAIAQARAGLTDLHRLSLFTCAFGALTRFESRYISLFCFFTPRRCFWGQPACAAGPSTERYIRERGWAVFSLSAGQTRKVVWVGLEEPVRRA